MIAVLGHSSRRKYLRSLLFAFSALTLLVGCSNSSRGKYIYFWKYTNFLMAQCRIGGRQPSPPYQISAELSNVSSF